MKQHWNRKIRSGVALIALGAWVLAFPSPAGSATAHKHGSAARTKQSAAHKVSSRTSARHSARRNAAAQTVRQRSGRRATVRRVSFQRKPAASSRSFRSQIRPEPERVQEIQRALAQAGYLNGEPSGRWDDQTRDAMRRYQADRGFPVTGLPEAKSLMKLGLGPHALPEALDSSAARASADTPRNDPASQQTSSPAPAQP